LPRPGTGHTPRNINEYITVAFGSCGERGELDRWRRQRLKRTASQKAD
jgi:hypothetical protein